MVLKSRTKNWSSLWYFKHKKSEILFLLLTSWTEVKPQGFQDRRGFVGFFPKKFLHEEQLQVGQTCSLGKKEWEWVKDEAVKETYIQICYNLLENWGRPKMRDWEVGREIDEISNLRGGRS